MTDLNYLAIALATVAAYDVSSACHVALGGKLAEFGHRRGLDVMPR